MQRILAALVLAASIALPPAFGAERTSPAGRSVGKVTDLRAQTVETHKLPVGGRAAVGAIASPNGGRYRGTGVLIGRCHVLTAHHVAFPAAPTPETRLEFHLLEQARGSRHSIPARVIAWGEHYWPQRHRQNDWALLALDRPAPFSSPAELLPDELTTETTAHLRPDGVVTSLGYVFGDSASQASSPSLRSAQCSIRARGSARAINCPLRRGNSGGPVLWQAAGKLFVVALNATFRRGMEGEAVPPHVSLDDWHRAVPLDPLSANLAAIKRHVRSGSCDKTIVAQAALQ
jgi:hypothetical protein